MCADNDIGLMVLGAKGSQGALSHDFPSRRISDGADGTLWGPPA
jgi:hypothetical protein